MRKFNSSMMGSNETSDNTELKAFSLPSIVDIVNNSPFFAPDGTVSFVNANVFSLLFHTFMLFVFLALTF